MGSDLYDTMKVDSRDAYMRAYSDSRNGAQAEAATPGTPA